MRPSIPRPPPRVKSRNPDRRAGAARNGPASGEQRATKLTEARPRLDSGSTTGHRDAIHRRDSDHNVAARRSAGEAMTPTLDRWLEPVACHESDRARDILRRRAQHVAIGWMSSNRAFAVWAAALRVQNRALRPRPGSRVAERRDKRPSAWSLACSLSNGRNGETTPQANGVCDQTSFRAMGSEANQLMRSSLKPASTSAHGFGRHQARPGVPWSGRDVTTTFQLCTVHSETRPSLT